MRLPSFSQACLLRSQAVVGALLVLASTAGPAAAEPLPKAELERARTLFQEGVALASANNCAAALVKYKAVVQVKMTPQVAFNIAECEERLGKLVEGLGNYRLAASLAADDKRAIHVLKEVGNRIDLIEPRIPRLTLLRGNGADAASIELDSTEIGQGQLGSAIPVNPGPHIVVARIGSKEHLRQTVNLEERETKTFQVTIHLPPPVVVKPAEPLPPPPPPPSHIPGIATTAAGGAALLTGLIAIGARQGAIGTLDTLCNDTHCPDTDQARSAASTGKTMTGLAEIMVPLGAVGLGVGIWLLVTSGPPKTQATDQNNPQASHLPSVEVVGWAPGASLGGASVMGRF